MIKKIFLLVSILFVFSLAKAQVGSKKTYSIKISNPPTGSVQIQELTDFLKGISAASEITFSPNTSEYTLITKKMLVHNIVKGKLTKKGFIMTDMILKQVGSIEEELELVNTEPSGDVSKAVTVALTYNSSSLDEEKQIRQKIKLYADAHEGELRIKDFIAGKVIFALMNYSAKAIMKDFSQSGMPEVYYLSPDGVKYGVLEDQIKKLD